MGNRRSFVQDIVGTIIGIFSWFQVSEKCCETKETVKKNWINICPKYTNSITYAVFREGKIFELKIPQNFTGEIGIRERNSHLSIYLFEDGKLIQVRRE